MDQFMEDFGRNQIGQEADNQLMDAFSLMDDDSIHHVHEPAVSLSGHTISATSTLELNDIVHNIWYSNTETTDHVTQQAQDNDVKTLVTPAESSMLSCENANISVIDNCSSTFSSSNGSATNSSLDRFTYQFVIEPNHAMKENESQAIQQSNFSGKMTTAFAHEPTSTLTELRNMEPPPVGLTYLGPVTRMKSAETQTDYVFGSDGLFVEAVARAVAKKLSLDEPCGKKLNSSTHACIQEVSQNSPMPMGQSLVEGPPNNMTTYKMRSIGKLVTVGSYGSSGEESSSRANVIRTSHEGGTKMVANLDVKANDVQSHITVDELPINEMCKVCEANVESKHVHYGGKSCHSCRAFFRRMSKTFAMYPDHTLNCHCDEKCFKKKKILCKIGPMKKKICKFCRYKKCQAQGEMEAKYVFKQNELEVATRYHCKKPKRIKEFAKADELEVTNRYGSRKSKKDTILTRKQDTGIQIKQKIKSKEENPIKLLGKKLNQFISSNSEVVKTVKKVQYLKGEIVPSDARLALKLITSHQVYEMAMNFDEFKKFETSVQVDVFKGSKTSLQRWGILKFIYDHVITKAATSSELFILYQMLDDDFWKCDNASTESSLIKRDKTRILTKIHQMVNADRSMLLFWFPLLLFSANERVVTLAPEIESHRLYYMHMLQVYIHQRNDNQEANAKKLAAVNELIYEINDL